jgi:hypothetical protein
MTPLAQHRRPVLSLLPDYDDPDPTSAIEALGSAAAANALAATGSYDVPLDDLFEACEKDDPTLVREEAQVPRFQSSVQLRKVRAPKAPPAVDATVRAFVTVLGDDQIELGAKLHALTSSLDSVPFDPSARAVGATLHRRAYDVVALRDALDAVYLVAFDASLAPLYEQNAPLGPFLKGLYIWSDGVLDALSQLATELRALDPSWASLRLRLAEASLFYFDGLVRDIDDHVDRLRSAGYGSARLDEMSACLDELFFAAHHLSESLDQKFG